MKSTKSKSPMSANDVTLIKKMLEENKGAGALSDATKKRIAALKMTLE